jgi:hypothetical protein
MFFRSLGWWSIFLALLVPATSHARAITEPYLQIFVVDPPKPIQWESPRSLLLSTFYNGAILDYAPNGHLAVYIKTRKPNAYGVKEVLTGMARTNKMKTMWDTIVKQYGLSAMTTTFTGDLDSSEATREELAKAYRQKRLSSIRVQLTDASAQKLMDFMHKWIAYGSYQHYGGNKNVPKGEGSGCADFAVHFIQMALNGHMPFPEWMANVYLPWNLLKEAPGRPSHPVSMWDMAMSGTPWARNKKEGLFFSIPDPERMAKWIRTQSPYERKAKIFPDEVLQKSGLESAVVLPKFSPGYPLQSAATVRRQWDKIRVKSEQ